MSAQSSEENALYAADDSVRAREHPNLAAALVAAQEEMPAVEKDATNPHFKSSFTSLGKLIATARPVLNRNGIAVIQLPSRDEGGKPTLVTRLVHTSGESMEESMPLILAKQDAQALGSALTYAKRYALAAALAIADQEDDDGNAAAAVVSEGSPPASVQQLDTLRQALSFLLPPGPDAAALVAVGEACGPGKPITVEVAKAVVAAIKARKDFENQDPDEGVAAAQDAAAEEPDAPSPDPVAAEGIESEIPADTEGLG